MAAGKLGNRVESALVGQHKRVLMGLAALVAGFSLSGCRLDNWGGDISAQQASTAGVQEVVPEPVTPAPVTPPAPTVPTVQEVVAKSAAMYGKVSTFQVKGYQLSQFVGPISTECDDVSIDVAASSDSVIEFTCVPTTLSLSFSLEDGAGNPVGPFAVSVPKPQVTMTTSLGNIVLELEPEKAPVTVGNFLGYVNSGYYDKTIFHRVIAGFMNQGGAFAGVNNARTNLVDATGDVGDPIPLEVNVGLSNTAGTIAMARTTVLDSATTSFFINAVDNVPLDTLSGGYAVFGHVVSGMSVVTAINAVPTQSVGAYDDVPSVDVVVNSAMQTK